MRRFTPYWERPRYPLGYPSSYSGRQAFPRKVPHYGAACDPRSHFPVTFVAPGGQGLVDQESVNEGVIVKTNDMSSNLDFLDLYHSLYTLCVFHVNEEISIQLGFALKGSLS
jgi:hypothetical protein